MEEDRSAEAIGGVASVADFGARNDGSTNDSPAFNDAIAYLAARGGGTVFMPGGGSGYSLEEQVLVSGAINGIHFRGAGMGSTKLLNRIVGTDADPCILLEASGNYFTLEGFELRGNGLTGAAGNGHGIAAVNPGGVLFPQHVVLRDVLVRSHQGTSVDELGASMPSCAFFGYKSTGFAFFHAFFYLCNQGLRLHEMENFSWFGGGIDACLLNASYLKDCHDLAFFGGNQQSSGSGGATDGNLHLTACENVQFYGTEFKNGWPYNVNARGATTVNNNVGFRGCGLTQLDDTRGHTSVSLNNASQGFTFDGCRFGFVNTMTDAKGIEIVQEAGGWNCTGFGLLRSSFTIGGGGTIAACLHFNVTSNRVIAPVIESNDFGFQHSIGSATTITDGVLFEGNVEGAAVRNNVVIGTANLTITNGFRITSANVLGLELEHNEYRANGGTLTNEVVNTAAVAFTRRDRTYVTAAAGSSAIPNAATSVVVSHGLSKTPDRGHITVTLGENPTNTPGAVWVDTITSTQFTVNCENDPGASGLDFGWRADIVQPFAF